MLFGNSPLKIGYSNNTKNNKLPFLGQAAPAMDNGKCIMDNDCVAIGDDSKSFPKEIPQLSIIHYPLSIRVSPQQTGIGAPTHRTGRFPYTVFAGCFFPVKWYNSH